MRLLLLIHPTMRWLLIARPIPTKIAIILACRLEWLGCWANLPRIFFYCFVTVAPCTFVNEGRREQSFLIHRRKDGIFLIMRWCTCFWFLLHHLLIHPTMGWLLIARPIPTRIAIILACRLEWLGCWANQYSPIRQNRQRIFDFSFLV